MKVGILAGGLGTRLSEETTVRPKPMVEIGGRPILWHIMKIYSTFGFNEFVIALGYKGEMIKDYFLNYHYRSHSLKINLSDNQVTVYDGEAENWVVHLLDTGQTTNTAGRVRQIAEYVGDETFMLTYGDGVANVDLKGLLDTHRRLGRLATVTTVHPPARFGEIVFDGELVTQFAEKPQTGEGWINGGFFVLEPGIKAYIDDDSILWEGQPVERLAKAAQLAAYRHEGYWQCMDSLREVRVLDNLWNEGKAPWKRWK
jgi:glucose-1-phosphate cytidylyltransferase